MGKSSLDRLAHGCFSCNIDATITVKFRFTSANHTQKSLSAYPFSIFFEEWRLDKKQVASALDNKGDIVIGNDVFIGWWNWSFHKTQQFLPHIMNGDVDKLYF